MDPITIAVFVAVFIAIIVAVSWINRRRGGGAAGGRGPYSPEAETRGDLAAFGATLSGPEDRESAQRPESNRIDDD